MLVNVTPGGNYQVRCVECGAECGRLLPDAAEPATSMVRDFCRRIRVNLHAWKMLEGWTCPGESGRRPATSCCCERTTSRLVNVNVHLTRRRPRSGVFTSNLLRAAHPRSKKTVPETPHALRAEHYQSNPRETGMPGPPRCSPAVSTACQEMLLFDVKVRSSRQMSLNADVPMM